MRASGKVAEERLASTRLMTSGATRRGSCTDAAPWTAHAPTTTPYTPERQPHAPLPENTTQPRTRCRHRAACAAPFIPHMSVRPHARPGLTAEGTAPPRAQSLSGRRHRSNGAATATTIALSVPPPPPPPPTPLCHMLGRPTLLCSPGRVPARCEALPPPPPPPLHATAVTAAPPAGCAARGCTAISSLSSAGRTRSAATFVRGKGTARVGVPGFDGTRSCSW